MATKRYSHSAAALGGKLYVIGGTTDDGETTLDQVEVYDPKADSWQPLPSMPTARHFLAAVAVKGKVYTIGGTSTIEDDEESCVDAVEAYDPISGAWTRLASLPVARCSHTATVVDGKIYVLGGLSVDPEYDYHGLSWTQCVDVYDPAADSWQQMAAMPTARDSHAAAVLDGKIYVTGGIPSECADALEVYDPAADTWTTLASMIQSRAYHASAVVKGKLWVFGGELPDGQDGSRSGRTNLVEVYSPASNSWASAADVPVFTDQSTAVAL